MALVYTLVLAFDRGARRNLASLRRAEFGRALELILARLSSQSVQLDGLLSSAIDYLFPRRACSTGNVRVVVRCVALCAVAAAAACSLMDLSGIRPTNRVGATASGCGSERGVAERIRSEQSADIVALACADPLDGRELEDAMLGPLR